MTVHIDDPRRRTRRRGRRFAHVAAAVGLAVSGTVTALAQATPSFAATDASVWLTTADQANKLTQQSPVSFGTAGSGPVITVDPNKSYQSVVGFGGSLTDAAAYNISNSPSRDTIMKNLFGSSGIGLSFLRQPIGTSDFSRAFYSLDDSASDDPSLSKFSIDKDKTYIVPLLKQALELNPQITVMGTPWSAPAWMKTNNNMVGGSLKTGNEDVFAQYLTKFVQAYKDQKIPITYLSVANEPDYSPNYPGMLMPAAQESTIINDLAPKLAAAGVGGTKILAFDRNWDNTTYPKQVLDATGSNTAGVAWHHYAGNPDSQTTVYNYDKSKEVLFTEGSWINGDKWAAQLNGQGGGSAINSLRNWSRTVTFWNLALDASGGPKIGNDCGCTAPVTTDGSNVTYNAEYYVLGHFSKFVKPGAVRIDSNVVGTVNNVAFKNPDHSVALVAQNNGTSTQTFQVSYNGSSFGYTLPAGAMATFTWPGTTGTAGPITGYQGLCLDVRGANSNDTTPVQVYNCNGTTAQSWTVESNTVKALGKCLDVTNGGKDNGTKVQLYQCNQTDAQIWQPQPNGQLYNPQSNKCLDDTAWGGSGTQAQIYDCYGTPNQRWNLP